MTGFPDALLAYDATDLAQLIRDGRLSSVQIIDAHFERIGALNERCNAFVTINKADARRRAAEADAALARGEVWGPLHGVPVSIKDAFETEKLRTTVGNDAFREFVPEKDASAVSRLKAAGAIVLGKSNCATLCGDFQTTNSIFGTTTNPFDVAKTSGGSSGGEAAAVAMGLSPMGIASDTAGSIRVPSSYCGVYGFKPSIGKVDRRGLRPLHGDRHTRPDSLSVVGPIARSLRDLALCHEVLCGERVVWDEGNTPRVLWTDEFRTQPIADDVRQASEAAFDQLVARGGNVTRADTPFDPRSLSIASFFLNIYEFSTAENGFKNNVGRVLEKIWSSLTGGEAKRYRNLKRRQSELSDAFEAFLDTCDCWVLPATPTTAFEHRKMGRPITIVCNGKRRSCPYLFAAGGLTAPINFLGNPSVVIPIGRTKEGMPIGLQLVGKKGADARLLSVARFIDERIGRNGSRSGPGLPETVADRASESNEAVGEEKYGF